MSTSVCINAHQEAESERGLPLPIEDPDDFILALRRPGVDKRPGFVDIPEDDASVTLVELDVRNWDAVYIRWRSDGGKLATTTGNWVLIS